MRIVKKPEDRWFEVVLDQVEWDRLEAGDAGICRDLNAVATVGWSGVIHGPDPGTHYQFEDVHEDGIFGVKEEE